MNAQTRRAPHVVAVFLSDRHYGGPEEGGWYYDAGELVRETRFRFSDENKAFAFARRFNGRLEKTLNAGRRPTSSVLSTGRFVARVYRGHAPQHYPIERPFYE